jgi:hypothetical protein
MLSRTINRPKVNRLPLNITRVLIGLGLLYGTVRIGLSLEVGRLMLPFVIIIILILSRLSLPLVALSCVYSWPLIGGMDVAAGGLVRLPSITLVILAVILSAAFIRFSDGTINQILGPNCLKVSCAFVLVFSIGILGNVFSENLDSPAVRFFTWDVTRVWFAYFALGLLSCRSILDVQLSLKAIPIFFLIFPLSISAVGWRDFITFRIRTQEVLGGGLSSEALNPNILGQAAAISAILAFVSLSVTRSRSTRLRWGALGIFSIAMTLFTASRQSLLAIMIGLATAALARGYKRGVAISFVVFLAGMLFVQLFLSILPSESGLRARYQEVTQSYETWDTDSAEYRRKEIIEGFKVWLKSPLFGHGFGAHDIDGVKGIEGSVVHLETTQIHDVLRGSHSLFLNILLHCGIIGLAAFGCGCFWAVRGVLSYSGNRSFHGQEAKNYLKSALPAFIVAILLVQNISGGFGMPIAILAYVLGALASAADNSIVGGRSARHPRQR